MSDTITFRHVIDSEAALRELYRLPHAFVTGKVKGDLDPGSIAFIGRSPFVLIGTQGPDGLDVSPRGGAPGFVKVLGPNTLAIPDLSGNNLLDTLTNVVRDGRVGLLFTVPGKDETLRVNGRALVVTDDDVLDRFVDDVRRPKAAIAVLVDQVFIHCAKAFRRSNLWQPETWAALADAPDGADILVCQSLGGDFSADQIRSALEDGYVSDLAAERPTS
ncbi:MAG TPA: MSMEG_1061 family FMN-dependent PPOX-type flavoprotein [Ilumatobacteraceae bacterium]